MSTPAALEEAPTRRSHSAAFIVASAIFLSRIFGLIRQRILSHYLGLLDGADAFTAAFRIPNLLQNLLGEGVLSASFIPVYARLRAEGREKEAVQVANAVFGLLALVAAIIVLLGVVLAAPLTDLVAPGFTGEKRALTIRLVRLLFPGAGLLVLSAWCLGILNSHRRFFLSYTAPIVWNVTIIAVILIAGRSGVEAEAAWAAALGSVIGSALQFLVQVPGVLRLLREFRPAITTKSEQLRTVVRNFFPVFFSRGIVQLSAFVDTIIASLLGQGPVTALQAAQVISSMPVSLFGMSVSAAELPAMSSETGSEEEIALALRDRINRGLRHIAFFVVPSAAAFLAFGGVIAAALFQTGKFTAQDSRFVWSILAGSAVGLLAATLGRLYSSALYALRDTRTPFRYSVIRMTLTIVLGVIFALPVPRMLGIDPRWGTAGLTVSAGMAAWIEFHLLRRAMNRKIGTSGLPLEHLGRLWLAALGGILVGFAAFAQTRGIGVIGRAALVLTPFGLTYLALTIALKVPEGMRLLKRLRSLRG
ncbi:MAG TPA: murein biosynthesis integral membrane protein MurJ [Gemmatimonadales bacterium]|nr:murein biosynthesis integral membrane protein MurJ [Gemmatimonadales bacterium]